LWQLFSNQTALFNVKTGDEVTELVLFAGFKTQKNMFQISDFTQPYLRGPHFESIFTENSVFSFHESVFSFHFHFTEKSFTVNLFLVFSESVFSFHFTEKSVNLA
ncbi:hypothetical protein ACJX0J_030940, partial [Zea mays]